MEQITKLSVHSLKVHPRNLEFFDDIEGDTYEQFKKSILEDGVITPIIVAPDMVVVSGNQRFKACVDLGIELIPAIIREELINEDLKLRQLIGANFGRLNNNPAKMRKAIAEYVGLVGNKGSGTYKQNHQVDGFKMTQKEIADELGISVQELERILSLERKLIPELQQAMDKGFISKTAALGICGKLDTSDQQDLLTELTSLLGDKVTSNPQKDKITVTNSEIQKLTEEVKIEKEKNQKLSETNTKLLSAQSEQYDLINQINDLRLELENKKPTDKPETLQKIKRLEEREVLLKEKIEIIEKDAEKYRQLKDQIETLTVQKDDIGRQISSATSISGLVIKIENFLQTELAPIEYSRALLEMKNNEVVINNVRDIIKCVEQWCYELKKYIPSDNNIYEIIDIKGDR